MRCNPARFRFVQAALVLSAAGLLHGAEAASETKPVSYYKQIRPILQEHCFGCHQPAKSKGKYVMTDFARMIAGGASGDAAIVPGNITKSFLIESITPVDGKAEMPDGKPPLHEMQIALVRQWVAQGAVDDTPVNAKVLYDAEHPPTYTRPPVISSIDWSPDGSLIAVAGFHEVLLMKADGSERVTRLIGLSERIESVRFSPDGTRLAVAAGLPARAGEIQIWNLEKKSLALSRPVTHDTIYGVSWSPDGKILAFGAADKSVQAIDAESGDQVLFQGAHDDWVLDTVFSVDGSHLISVGREGTAKLTEVATQRFVDNITSITPGALKGGLLAVARHPQRDEIVIGGADGTPKIYRVHRMTNRVIGDDANIVREFPAMTGRIFDLAVSRDGARIAAVSSLDGRGMVRVYGYEFDTAVSDDLKKILAKQPGQWSKEEREAVNQYTSDGVRVVGEAAIDAALYAVAFSPDGAKVATAGADGVVRLFDAATGKEQSRFSPAPISAVAGAEKPKPRDVAGHLKIEADGPALSAAGETFVSIEVFPKQALIAGPWDYVQVLVTGVNAAGERADLTRAAGFAMAQPIAKISREGFVLPVNDGKTVLAVKIGGHSVEIPVEITGVSQPGAVNFIRDVNPVLTRIGCNQGTCHGSAQGKNGFKLSLRGYDPIFDLRAMTDDHASRRVNVAVADSSLALLKGTGAAPHEGGVVFKPGDPYYRVLRDWISQGTALDLQTPRVSKIEIEPRNPIVQKIGSVQQFRVIATYADGRTRDVTREAFVDTGNGEVAVTDREARATAIRRGEAAILARYEGAYVATTMTVMGDRAGFTWKDPPVNGRIDELVAAKWQRMKILPSELCDDLEFLRRVHLDLTGLPPTPEQINTFQEDARSAREKRDALIDTLVGSDAYVEHWANKWADLLQVNRKFLGVEGATAFRGWIREHVAKNTPYDRFAYEVVSATGSNRENPAASYYKILRDPENILENTTHLFLAVRFNCNKCHDHPFERWTQDQYYETAAYFAQVNLQADPQSGDKKIGGTAVEGAKPLYEIVRDDPKGSVKHQRTGEVMTPAYPYAAKHEEKAQESPRRQFAEWMISSDNQYFSRSYVNRIWGYLTGVGIIEPIDDIRAGNPPTNPELLAYLEQRFIDSKFDTQAVIREICQSRVYQMSIRTNEWNADDKINYSHAQARRLPAEVLYDSLLAVTGSTSKFPGVKPGTRAAELPDSGVDAGGFLATFGRPTRESSCECERSSSMELGPVMSLVSGPTLADAIADSNNTITKLVAKVKDDRALINAMFVRILNRPATDAEVAAVLESMARIQPDHAALLAELAAYEPGAVAAHEAAEKQRAADLTAAKTDLAAYEQSIAADRQKKEEERLARVKSLEEKIQQQIAARRPEWEKQQLEAAKIEWVPLLAENLKASNGSDLVRGEDLAVTASGKEGKTVYALEAKTRLRDIRSFRLEAIADDGKGPGRAGNGNFVLTEFEVSAAPESDAGKKQKIKFKKARADFDQDSYDIKLAIDGKNKDNKGWAVAPATGVTHWATFETKQPVGFEEGTILTIQMHQNYDPKHVLQKFRISVTSDEKAGLGLSEELQAIVMTPDDQRTDAQKSTLARVLRAGDGEIQKLDGELAEANKPLPEDPGVTDRKARISDLEQPTPPDPRLVRLREASAMSAQQIESSRLTAAQDLAWALINSPAFLFNH